MNRQEHINFNLYSVYTAQPWLQTFILSIHTKYNTVQSFKIIIHHRKLWFYNIFLYQIQFSIYSSLWESGQSFSHKTHQSSKNIRNFTI